MAIQKLELQNGHEEQTPSVFLDSLYCEEDKWEVLEEDEEEEEDETTLEDTNIIKNSSSSLVPLFDLRQNLFIEDEDLASLFTKEQEQLENLLEKKIQEDLLYLARKEAVGWILKVNAYYGFTTLTAVLAINYLDRFLFSLHSQIYNSKPWMIQLVSITCFSLAAKVEETQAPLLLDLQVEETNYVFNAKTIQRMELLVLSTLKWKMHPVTPFSFLDHIITRLGLKTHLHLEFLKRCQHSILSLISDARFMSYLPSVLAAATMIYVIDQIDPVNSMEYHNQLLGVLKINKDQTKNCYDLIMELLDTQISNNITDIHRKRKHFDGSTTTSPGRAIDSFLYRSLVSSSPEPPLKKNRGRQQDQTRPVRLNRVVILASP